MSKIIKSGLAKDAGIYRIPLQKLVIGDECEPAPENEPALVVEDEPSEADIIIQEAEEAARRILISARNEAEALKKKAEQSAREMLFKERENLLDELRETISLAKRMRSEVIRVAEPQVVELSLMIAQALIKTSLLIKPELIRDIVANAISVLDAEESLIVRVNPDDLEMCRSYKGYLRELMADGTSIKILASEDVQKGGCIVQGEFALIESCLETRFNILKSALLEEAEYVSRSTTD